jgi:hypothetical protein
MFRTSPGANPFSKLELRVGHFSNDATLLFPEDEEQQPRLV